MISQKDQNDSPDQLTLKMNEFQTDLQNRGEESLNTAERRRLGSKLQLSICAWTAVLELGQRKIRRTAVKRRRKWNLSKKSFPYSLRIVVCRCRVVGTGKYRGGEMSRVLEEEFWLLRWDVLKMSIVVERSKSFQTTVMSVFGGCPPVIIPARFHPMQMQQI